MTLPNEDTEGIIRGAGAGIEDEPTRANLQSSLQRSPSVASEASIPLDENGPGESGVPARSLTGRQAITKTVVASIAYFKTSESGVRMKRCEPDQPSVLDFTTGDKGFKAMDARWEEIQPFGIGGPPSFRWIHLPANDPEWVKDALYQILNSFVRPRDATWAKTDSFAKEARDEIMSRSYWSDQQSMGHSGIHHSRFMRPFCRQFPTSASSVADRNANDHLVFLMPYLHWENGDGFAAIQSAVQSGEPPPEYDGGSKAAFKVLKARIHDTNPQHIRRTLDQSYYSNLQSTQERDKDQVVQRYARDVAGKSKADYPVPPMLMVDQCWLWIIGGDTVLSAFPRRWDVAKNPDAAPDASDIQASIFEFLSDDKNLNKIRSAKALAHVIIDHCASSVLDLTSFVNENMQFLRYFDESIDRVMIAQAGSMEELLEKVNSNGTRLVDESMLKIGDDFKTLQKIKDIKEELMMLTHVVRHQRKAIDSLANEEVNPSNNQTLGAPPSSHKGSQMLQVRLLGDNEVTKLPTTAPLLPSSPNGAFPDSPVGASQKVHFGEGHLEPKPPAYSKTMLELLSRTRVRESDLSWLITKAESTYQALHDLLDLKQRQANLSEAQSARVSATEMEKQSSSIMLFTVVTILFLPLSSLASIFGINAVEFGQGTVKLGIIFLYLFLISAFVVAVTFLLAFNNSIRRILLLWLELFGRSIFSWFPTAAAEEYVATLEDRLKSPKERKTRSVESTS